MLLSISCAAQTDVATGIKVSRAEARSIDRLAHALCDGLGTEREKAAAIYNWVAHNIRYDVKSAMDGRLTRDDDAKRVLRKRKTVCEGYAHVFMQLCQAAGLQAVTVEGYARDWIFDNGDSCTSPPRMECSTDRWPMATRRCLLGRGRYGTGSRLAAPAAKQVF